MKVKMRVDPTLHKALLLQAYDLHTRGKMNTPLLIRLNFSPEHCLADPASPCMCKMQSPHDTRAAEWSSEGCCEGWQTGVVEVWTMLCRMARTVSAADAPLCCGWRSGDLRRTDGRGKED